MDKDSRLIDYLFETTNVVTEQTTVRAFTQQSAEQTVLSGNCKWEETKVDSGGDFFLVGEEVVRDETDEVPDEWKLYVLEKQNKMVRNYLSKYWGYTKRMIDEVMETGQTPHRAEYLEDGTRIQGRKLLTTTEKKDNLRKYLSNTFQYSTRILDEIQETGESSSLKYMDKLSRANETRKPK